MMNNLQLNMNMESWIKFVPDFAWIIWVAYFLSIVFIAGYLISFSLVHQDKGSYQNHFWRLLQMMLNVHYSRNRVANASFSLYTVFGVIGIWLFNVIFCALINTELVSFPKSSVPNTLQEYYRSSLTPCWTEGKHF